MATAAEHRAEIERINGEVATQAQKIAELSAILDGKASGGKPVIEPLTVTENGTYTAPSGVDGYSPVVVDVPTGGSAPTAEYNDVIYIDFDGTILYSYSANEFKNLTAAPELPSRDGLTCQGWNWTLSDAKTHVNKYGALVIGAIYITDDGKTRLYIRLEDGRLSPTLGLAVNGTCSVDWGDGSSQNITGSSATTLINTQHTYVSPGEYIICLTVISGTVTITGSSSYGSRLLWKQASNLNQNACYRAILKKVEIGLNVTVTGNAFYGCTALETVTIPNLTAAQTGLFRNCYVLNAFVIPNGAMSIDGNTFYNTFGIKWLSIPKSVNNYANYSMYYCPALEVLTLPEGVSTLSKGIFWNDYGLKKITIPSTVSELVEGAFYQCTSLSIIRLPANVTTIGAQVFYSCAGLKELHFESTSPPTVSNSSAFSGIPTDCVIYVPTGCLSAYTSATNYPDSATYTYVEE